MFFGKFLPCLQPIRMRISRHRLKNRSRVTVRAMYDYEAQDPEEFSFQANDIIAVHSTDSSGWWTGELLDENRRFLGRTIFPSNL